MDSFKKIIFKATIIKFVNVNSENYKIIINRNKITYKRFEKCFKTNNGLI